ncbi:exo-beta-N-acetylmuramidase NamZ family protein [Microtetraspora malaysiensis]|uniref:exo-beta-N-acetylmuramidase NamZ family protein n=1 Tax=Microtetraspora malaysiensis TaxID=161358 RepID=UPI003D91BC63
MSHVRTGAERLAANPGLLRGGRIGLVTNPTGVLPDLTPTASALLAAGVPLAALFGPEHGIRGTAQAGFSEDAGQDPATGLPVLDTYGRSGDALDAVVAASGVDTLVFDIADVGTRFYTFMWTMHDLMASAARLGLRFAVLDRPNPLGGTRAEGPALEPSCASFVGRAPLPVRHGLTLGELALLFNKSIGVDLTVVVLEGWRRSMHFADTGLPWIMPSVNMPTPDTALVYPGTGLVEGTSASEGRGTTRPFELVGAPWLDDGFASGLNGLGLPGVRFRDTWFTPAFHKHAGAAVRGVQVHVHDAEAFQPVLTGVSILHLLRSRWPEQFAWTTADPAGTGVEGGRHFIDLLWGSPSLRERTDAGDDPRDLCPSPCHPEAWLYGGKLLYP